MTHLPIDDVLPALVAALRDAHRVVLQAPPGAGKSSRVPLAILDAALTTQKIVMLEPRRLAARATAERLASQLDEKVGQTVGYRMRGAHVAGKRIEVVTEGILIRMLQSDPELGEVGALIFDEFHERSVDADLGLALAWEIAQALRPDLHLIIMSATLDAAPVARFLGDAPIITAEGRSYPITTHYLQKPTPKHMRLPEATAALITKAAAETTGGILAFLPGEGEINRTAALLDLPPDHHIRPLFGAMPFQAQRAAITPEPNGRKIVLATAIAETSLTIEDIRVVVDAGRARRARFDPNTGMSRLVTEPVSKAEATQRAGRAGRVAPGEAYCLWTKAEQGAFPAFAPAGIEIADLAPLVLELSLWGDRDLAFLTPPPPGPVAEATSLLQALGALDADAKITAHGRNLAAQPLHPRLAHMLVTAGAQAAPLAAILSARDPLRGAPVDLHLRVKAIAPHYDGPGQRAPSSVLKDIRSEAVSLAKGQPNKPPLSLATQAALAYPDRIGLRRKGEAARYVLSGGKGAVVDASDPLASARLIVATDLDGDQREARIRQAIALTDAELRALYSAQIAWHDMCTWSRREGRVLTRKQERFGALVLDDRNWQDAPSDMIAKAMLAGVQQLGLHFSPAAARFRARVTLARARNPTLPDMSDEVLRDTVETWLLPYLGEVKTAADWKAYDLLPALRAMCDWAQTQELDEIAPAHFETPLGRRVPIDYDPEVPQITLRIQELFGTTVHPTVGTTPLRVVLLSPGQKPVQVTTDIPAFWATSYADVRRDMRGRYPRHPWPEDPTQADPTLRAKPRGT
jgi:ATP-dependent helicase HrpB